MNNSLVIVVMGVSASGKSTVGKLLADEVGGHFLDGDDFHSPENVSKMAAGIPLTDEDRVDWLERIAEKIKSASQFTVIACSALKEQYREVLKPAKFVFLDGPAEVLAERIAARTDHYMPPSLLDSQLEALEKPESPNCLIVDFQNPPAAIVTMIRNHFTL